MARWRLTDKHYLNIAERDGQKIEWEYKETSTVTGRQVRKTFTVPLYLDPNQPDDQNYPGVCIVANKESREYPRDYIFLGEPTPDMEPLDVEAETITNSVKDKWIHPIESLRANGFTETFLQGLQKQMSDVAALHPIALSAGQVSVTEFTALREQVALLMARNSELEAEREPKAARR